MGYIYLLCVAIMFSFGGTCAKNITPYFGPEFITFFRFFFGVVFLFALKLIKRQKFQADFKEMFKVCLGWIIFGAVAKWGAYIMENYGLAHGPSYGNIITQPAQAVFITVVSVVMFKEKMTLKKVFCIFLCLAGVLCISWNGRPLDEFFESNVLLTGLFVLSGFCAGAHVLAQKMIADRMDIIDSNLSIFAIAAVLAAVPTVPGISNRSLVGIHPGIACVIAILAFGFITGIGFYLNAKAIPLVPFYMVPIIQSTMVIFAILWGMLFFHEKITRYIVVGTIIFLVGLISLNILNKKPEKDAV